MGRSVELEVSTRHSVGSSGAHFIGHSFGTIVLAWLVNKRPDLVKHATFLDPVCFLLMKPDIRYVR